jgi:DNA-binding NtrC family response regulator
VHTASHGDQAVAYAENLKQQDEKLNHFFLDLTIPGGKGGTDVIEFLKKIYPDAIYIAVSGYAENPVMEDPKTYGFTWSMRKPFKWDQLKELIDNCELLT